MPWLLDMLPSERFDQTTFSPSPSTSFYPTLHLYFYQIQHCMQVSYSVTVIILNRWPKHLHFALHFILLLLPLIDNHTLNFLMHIEWSRFQPHSQCISYIQWINMFWQYNIPGRFIRVGNDIIGGRYNVCISHTYYYVCYIRLYFAI